MLVKINQFCNVAYILTMILGDHMSLEKGMLILYSTSKM